MSRNGSGIYVLPAGQPVVTGTTISSTTHNTLMSDLANALTTSIASDGQTAMSANLPMGGNKLTGLAAATVAGDAVRYEQAAMAGALSGSGITGAVAVGANSIQIGSSATDSQNFLLKSNLDGTGKLARGAAGGLGDILVWDATGKLNFAIVPAAPAQSMIKLSSANGYGSTNTKIRRFTNVLSTQGTDITYADSATLGASFTVNVAGVYAVVYIDQFNVDAFSGLSLNTTQPTVSIATISANELICAGYASSANAPASVTPTQYYAAGSVIRPHTQGAATGINTTNGIFTITRVS